MTQKQSNGTSQPERKHVNCNGSEHKPNITFTGVLEETDTDVTSEVLEYVEKQEAEKDYAIEIVWGNVYKFIIFHAFVIFGLYYTMNGRVSGNHFLALVLYTILLNFGIAGGAHRLWAHKAYKAKPALKLVLLYLQTAAGQNSLYDWVRDHRMHHKFTETNADPHSMKRGFFFAHMGWLMCKKHPDLKAKGPMIDMSDLEKDPIIMWQHRNYVKLFLLTALVIPAAVFRVLTHETWLYILTGLISRYAAGLHLTWLINSYAHAFGNRPYDKHIQATNSKFMGYLGLGEGFHNYHHVFPWDYRAAELHFYKGFNLTGLMIDGLAKLGLAYDLKTVDQNMIKNRVLRTGDGTHHVWGWGDKDIPKEHVDATITLNEKLDPQKKTDALISPSYPKSGNITLRYYQQTLRMIDRD